MRLNSEPFVGNFNGVLPKNSQRSSSALSVHPVEESRTDASACSALVKARGIRNALTAALERWSRIGVSTGKALPAEVCMVSKDFLLRLGGYGLTTAEIHYHLPDHPKFLQLYVWQEYDLAPGFPLLKGFLAFWQRELEGALHSVRVAHNRLLRPSEWKAVEGVFRLN
ncbi:MAG TPA: usg protein [Rhizomicrobium sp.]|nr:usg protein [Rhizomicrobium sp.]